MTRSAYINMFLAVVLAGALSSCAMFRGGDGGATPDAAAATDVPAPAVVDYEAALRETVREYMAGQNAQADLAGQEVQKKDPYWFKEYAEYPAEPGEKDIIIQETESLTTPYVADVQLQKVRFITEMHRKKDEARADADFRRDTGTEVITFEWRNGQWMRAGSLFVAERVEELVDGQWQPVAEEQLAPMAAGAPADEGWWRRAWGFVTGQ